MGWPLESSQSLDPNKGATIAEAQLWEIVYEGLVETGDHLEPKPDLATSWKQNSPTEWVFNIRRGVRFSNGREMTVDDVVGSLRRVTDPKNGNAWASQFGEVKRIAASGPWQVKITLATPRPALLAALAQASVAILPMKELKAGSFKPGKELLGTGPWEVIGHSKDDSWTFGPNPHYWRNGLPKANRLVVRIIPDESARVAALRNGDIDATWFSSQDAADLVRGIPDVKSVVQDATDFFYLGVNSSPSSIFRNHKLRQAVSMAIDRHEIIKLALAGNGRPTAASSAPFDVCKADEMPFATPNIDAARKLVTDEGADGKPVTIIAGTHLDTLSPVAQVLQQNLEAIGLKVRVVPVEVGEMFKRVYSGTKFGTGDFDMVVNYFPGYADPAMTLRSWNPNIYPFVTSWLPSDDKLNRLIVKSQTTPAGPDRDQALKDTCARIAEDASLIPLVTSRQIVAYRSDLAKAPVQPIEGYGIVLRRYADFLPNKG